MNQQKKTFTSGQILGLIDLIMGAQGRTQKKVKTGFDFRTIPKFPTTKTKDEKTIIAIMKENKNESEKIQNSERV